VPQVGGELRAAEDLEEVAPVVAVNLRGVDPGTFDAERIHT
jgi:hypothetical protein